MEVKTIQTTILKKRPKFNQMDGTQNEGWNDKQLKFKRKENNEIDIGFILCQKHSLKLVKVSWNRQLGIHEDVIH